jgi:hypothetical protein
MLRFLKTCASSTVGKTAQPTRPPVQEYDFDTPEITIVRSGIPGSDAIEW